MSSFALKISTIISLIFATSMHLPAAEKLYVFYPSSTRPHIISEKLQNVMNGVKVYVFGRYSDFIARVTMEPPDAVLTKTSLIQQLDNYTVVLRGARENRTDERFVLVSVSGKNQRLRVDSETIIGMVDYFGRNGTLDFVKQFFPDASKIKRVTKPEDLMPLLIFDMADCVMVEENSAEFLANLSNRPLSIVPLNSQKQGIVAIATLKNRNDTAITNCLKKYQKETTLLFGIDQWK